MSQKTKPDSKEFYQDLGQTTQLVWQRAKNCGGGACVEVAKTESGNIALRDSKNPKAGTLLYTPKEWRAFTKAIQNGEFVA